MTAHGPGRSSGIYRVSTKPAKWPATNKYTTPYWLLVELAWALSPSERKRERELKEEKLLEVRGYLEEVLVP